MKKQPTTSKPGALPRFLGARCIAGLLPGLVLLLSIQPSHAGSATWKPNPSSGDWHTAGNWEPPTIPNGPSDTATFNTSTRTAISVPEYFATTINSIVYNAGASAFTTTPRTGSVFFVSGVGITNNSGITQTFAGVLNSDQMVFSNSATAGDLVAFSNISVVSFYNTSSAGTASFECFDVYFLDNATASNGRFTIDGTTFYEQDVPRVASFRSTSTAGNATLIANGPTFTGWLGGTIQFYDDSTGGTARVEVFAQGNLDISGHYAPGMTIGSIEGSGAVFLGANKLAVGSNNLSTAFSGLIQDGGISHGSRGSLTKTGMGKLTLSEASTYTGGTTVSRGTLRVTNTTGSATGTGPVQVNAGTLSGTGKIHGAVTVGTGTRSGAIVLPGNSATAPGILTINSALTFNRLSTYKCVLNRSTPIAGEITAFGVTINSGATFTFVDTGTGTLTVGTVFTVINNTSANPIFGTFSNLSDGSVFTSNGNNFQASYTGGTGNDLTLTVVP
jgi:autotransporter-associated beta strand protein